MLHFLAVAKKPEPAKDDKEEDELTSEFSSIELFHAGDDLEFEEEELIGSFIIQYLEAPFIADRRSGQLRFTFSLLCISIYMFMNFT